MKTIINTTKAPAAVGPYSQATIGNNTLYISGQLPINPETSEIPETLELQVTQSMKNIMAIVEEAGATAKDIVKCGLYIRDMSQFAVINKIYSSFFTEEPPARFVIEVSALPKGADVEIEAIAVL